jgi:hypothetical protein
MIGVLPPFQLTWGGGLALALRELLHDLLEHLGGIILPALGAIGAIGALLLLLLYLLNRLLGHAHDAT